MAERDKRSVSCPFSVTSQSDGAVEKRWWSAIASATRRSARASGGDGWCSVNDIRPSAEDVDFRAAKCGTEKCHKVRCVAPLMGQ
jgi:hypothetical protein